MVQVRVRALLHLCRQGWMGAPIQLLLFCSFVAVALLFRNGAKNWDLEQRAGLEPATHRSALDLLLFRLSYRSVWQ